MTPHLHFSLQVFLPHKWVLHGKAQVSCPIDEYLKTAVHLLCIRAKFISDHWKASSISWCRYSVTTSLVWTSLTTSNTLLPVVKFWYLPRLVSTSFVLILIILPSLYFQSRIICCNSIPDSLSGVVSATSWIILTCSPLILHHSFSQSNSSDTFYKCTRITAETLPRLERQLSWFLFYRFLFEVP